METFNIKRRSILIACVIAGLTGLVGCIMNNKPKNKKQYPLKSGGNATIFRSVNGSPAQNMRKVLELSGGIEKLIGADDFVIIKPNLQWWNQGAPNISGCLALIESIFERKDYTGEVVLMENTHRGNQPWKTTGWATPFRRNSDIPGVDNYNDLSSMLKKRFGNRFSVCHLIDVGVNGRRVFTPKDGQGYIYCDGTGGAPFLSMDNGLPGSNRREVIMTYPIFTTDRGTCVDFKNGIWKEDAYTGQPVKFINLAALNHHSTYCGMTSSVKNYFGIVDLSNGANPHNSGKVTDKYFNFHSFAFDEWANGPVPGMLGAEIGMFLNTIRKADLNITTAEWVGLASRTDCPVAHTRAVLASADSIALDYHASKYVLFQNSRCRHHDPDWQEGPLFQYLYQCAKVSGGVLDEARIKVVSHNFKMEKNQASGERSINAGIDWGNDPKMLAKYGLFRWGSMFL